MLYLYAEIGKLCKSFSFTSKGWNKMLFIHIFMAVTIKAIINISNDHIYLTVHLSDAIMPLLWV